MRFEERELAPYALPLSSEQFKLGNVYFSVQYADEDLLVPIVETLVFVGRKLIAEDGDLFYFQDVESYGQGIRHNSVEADKAQFQLGEEGKIHHIFEYEQALEELMKCSLRRRKKLDCATTDNPILDP